MNNMIEKELSWDDVIEREGNEYIILPEGDYDFVVESFYRGRHEGSEKLPACNKAVLKIRIDSAQGTVFINHNLFLHTITEGMLSAFFTSIGQKKKGEPLRMDWGRVPGSTGRAKVGIRTYQKNGETRQANEIKRFYPKEDAAASQRPSYKAGEF